MKNLAAVALIVAASFISAASATAQDRQVKVTVPFNFTVGNQTLPSGAYTIRRPAANSPSLVALRNWDKKIDVMTLSQANQGSRGQDNTLVFHKYGDQYYLSEIRCEGAAIDVRFPATKAEKKAREQVQEAGLFVDDPVLIALN